MAPDEDARFMLAPRPAVVTRELVFISEFDEAFSMA
jgi:hypothetical protein